MDKVLRMQVGSSATAGFFRPEASAQLLGGEDWVKRSHSAVRSETVSIYIPAVLQVPQCNHFFGPYLLPSLSRF
jgi:hypothetical protein